MVYIKVLTHALRMWSKRIVVYLIRSGASGIAKAFEFALKAIIFIEKTRCRKQIKMVENVRKSVELRMGNGDAWKWIYIWEPSSCSWVVVSNCYLRIWHTLSVTYLIWWVILSWVLPTQVHAVFICIYQ